MPYLGYVPWIIVPITVIQVGNSPLHIIPLAAVAALIAAMARRGK